MNYLNKTHISSTSIIFVVFVAIFCSINITHASDNGLTPLKLFSTNVGTSTKSASSSIGVLSDERITPRIKDFYYPVSFSVDKDSGKVAVLDSARNRVVLFSIDGQYVGDISLPFKMRTIDFVWFPHTNDMLFVFQGMLKIGLLKIDPADKFTIKRSFLFDISKIPTIGASSTIMGITSLDIPDTKNNFFLNLIGTSSNPEFVQTDTGIHGIADSAKELSASWLKGVKIGTTSIESSFGSYNLSKTKLIGNDGSGNFYMAASYIDDTQVDPVRTVVYRIDSRGSVTGKTEVFASPQMLTNHYLIIDKQGLIFFMHADDKQTISFYQFKINDIRTPSKAILPESKWKVISSIISSHLVGIFIIVSIIFIIVIITLILKGKKKTDPFTIQIPPTPKNQ